MLDSGFGIPLGTNPNEGNHDHGLSSRKCIWLSQEELTPNNLEGILEVFRIERTPLKYWLLLAFSYKSLGHLESFDSLLKESETMFSTDQYTDFERGSLYSSLAFHNLSQAFQFKNDDERHTRYMDWTNHYTRKTEGISQYHFYLLKGHQNLMSFMRDKNRESLSVARSMFQMSISCNQSSIISFILFGNAMVLNSNYQVASIYYLRSLLMTKYYHSIIDNVFKDSDEFELYLVKSQLTWIESLLLFALAACQFSLGNIESSKSLIERSLMVKPLSVSYRLLSAITAYQLTHFKDGVDGLEGVNVDLLLKEYTTSFLSSYNLDKSNPVSQLYMCEFLFHRGEYDECSRRLFELQKSNLNYNLKPELEYQIGRLYHVQGKYSEALNNYMNAIGFKNDFMSARLQLIKVASACGDLTLAREHCDFLLQCIQKVSVVLKIAAYVYLSSARETLETNRWDMLKLECVNKSYNQLDISCMFHTVQQGISKLIDERLFKSLSLLDEYFAVTSSIGHSMVSFELFDDLNKLSDKVLNSVIKGEGGNLTLNSSPKEGELYDHLSIEYYIRCLEILISRGREYLCPKLKDFYFYYFNLYNNHTPQFVNNFGVILMLTRNYNHSLHVLKSLYNSLSPSEDCFNQDKNPIQSTNGVNHIDENGSNTSDIVNKILLLTITFNYSLSLEFNGQLSKAQKLYSNLTLKYPKYISSWLRKSIISFNKGDYDSSVRYLEQVKKIHPLSCEPYLMRSYQLGKLKFYDEAIQEIRKMFRTIPSSTYDPYANTLLASLMIKKAYKISQSTSTPVSVPKEAMQHAKTALKRPSVCNFYAANCIAVLLALEKNLKGAYESFLLLLESLSVTSHMKLLVNKNMGILSSALTLAFMTTDKKLDRSKLNKLKVAKTQQHFQTAISNGKMDKNLYMSYIRFLFDVQKYDECIATLETARIIFQDETFAFNQIIVTDSMICSYLRDAEKTNSVFEMTNMLSGCMFIISTSEYFLTLSQRGSNFLSTDSINKLKQILQRVKTKVLPHISSTLPQLEKSCENKQRAREKRLQLQLTIQQAQEAKKRQMEQERIKAAEAEEALSQQLLKEASEIASELLTNKPTQT